MKCLKNAEYKNQIKCKINNTENITRDSLEDIMKQPAIETVGKRKKIKEGYEFNNEIQHLSTMQKEIRIKMNTFSTNFLHIPVLTHFYFFLCLGLCLLR